MTQEAIEIIILKRMEKAKKIYDNATEPNDRRYAWGVIMALRDLLSEIELREELHETKR